MSFSTFTQADLIEAASTDLVKRWLAMDRKAQKYAEAGTTHRRDRARAAASDLWSYMTDVQREAARRMWRELS